MSKDPSQGKFGKSSARKAPKVIQKVDQQQLKHFVTEIKSAEEQVGENIIRALGHDDTVAVLTTVVLGPDGQQQVVTAALNPDMMEQVREVLVKAEEDYLPEDPCIGFHCLVRPRQAPHPDKE